MGNAKEKRKKQRGYANELFAKFGSLHKCMNCGRQTKNGHFIPPSLGAPGFYYCHIYDKKNRESIV